MIISASRRTDICAFHSEWLMNRLDAGYVLVRNPVHRSSVQRVPLTPDRVDHMVFITKDPRPMLAHLSDIVKDYDVSFQVTITPYDGRMEPNVPDADIVMESFIQLSGIVGPDRCTWRYDPVILYDRFSVESHLDTFDRMCSVLKGHTRRCIFSFLEHHRKSEDILAHLGVRSPSAKGRDLLVSGMERIATANGMELSSCCTDGIGHLGISRRACIDGRSMKTWGIPYTMPSAQVREGCGCVKVVDIGEYDTCSHDCRYCYANSASSVERRGRRYDPNSEMLVGHLSEGDIVTEMVVSSQTRLM